ncbi:putative DNA polymerase alpha catalytic subunit [Aspergillus rambellii]|uniref:DNA polymerase n=1 Tax=Aspergillus rambellii TaxID=308745 RepID=A0A0F8UW65_9EURO|nr:putative DNA polymerase alpha catalytic subunit [Aspergillus rambellii]
MAVTLPSDVLFMILDVLGDEKDYNSLYQCALASKCFTEHALSVLYRYIRYLDLDDLGDLLGSNKDVKDELFTPELLDYVSQEYVSEGNKRRRSPRTLPDNEWIKIKLGSVAPTTLNEWIEGSPQLQALTVWSGSTLSQHAGQKIHDHCPEFKQLRIYSWQSIAPQNADTDAEELFKELHPNSLEYFEVLSFSHLGSRSIKALGTQRESLVELKLTYLDIEAIAELPSLSELPKLEVLALTDSMPTTWNDQFYTTIGQVADWIRSCKKLKRLDLRKFVDDAELLTQVLANNEIRLTSLSFAGYMLANSRGFFDAVCTHQSLEVLYLQGEGSETPEDNEKLVQALIGLQDLRELELKDVSDWFTMDHVMTLTPFLPRLERLWISGEAFDDSVWSAFLCLQNLQSLAIYALSNFTAEGVLDFITQLGPGNRGLSLSILNAASDIYFPEEAQNLIREILATKLDGSFDFGLVQARAKLAELKALRAAGKKRLSTYEVEEQGDIYEEVDDEGYKKIIRNRLDEDDFVVDDNGEGYADDGREVWNERGERYGDSNSEDDELPARGKAAKRKREEEKQRKEKINNGISKYFNSGSANSAPKSKPVATAEDEAFMADLLGEVDTNIVSKHVPKHNVVKSETRRKVRILSPPLSDRTRTPKGITKDANSDPVSPGDSEPALNLDNDDGPFLHADDDDDDVPMSDPMPSSPVSKAVERKYMAPIKAEEPEEDDNDLMEVTQATGHLEAGVKTVNMAGSRPTPSLKKELYPPMPASSSPMKAGAEVNASWNDVRDKLNVLNSPASEPRSFGKLSPKDVVEEDGSLRMFWLDYTEVNGSLCLFGKVKNKQNGSYASAFVKVDSILRKLYFLPRDYRHKHGRDTDEEVDMEDMYHEVDAMMSRLRVGMHKMKPCTRKYAFELPGVPKKAEYLKLLYPYDKPALPMDTKGETFSHIFGSNTSLFEQFVLWKNIMGPCWLQFEEADFSAVNNASWCKFECQTTKPALISPVPDSENLEAPPLTLMSLSFRTQLNVKENKQEILVASARVYENVSLTDTTPPEKLPCKTFTVMRPSGSSYPVHFEAEVRKQRGTYILEKSEQFLLSKFLALFERMDPDVLMGHQLQEVDLSVFLSRLKEKKTPGWHRIGRLKRGEWPKNFNRGGGFFTERHLIAGRLMCDVANDMGKSLMMKCQSWSLTEMCNLYLGPGNARQDLDIEAALKTWAGSKDGLINFVNHCDADTYFIAALVLRLQMLSLTKVLTNIAGNSWARTLSGTRAERNEYILLHEFHRNKYICPDKYSAKLQKAEERIQEGDDEDSADKKKKDKYKGGLVFEPERGLYDRFVLVMDFNSLYPSIIQEYNICFTTVDRTASAENENEEKVPEVPPSDAEQGILPRLIATLVGRRREVKKLMKDKRATPEQLALWDTKQLAFKLTANSMYGCLGYTQSRFYARPLAMLTTFKGREILRSTKELAESKQLRVIYGDTDSVMINTNMDTISDALKVGEEFKKSVNERYRLLEIDIDNIFRRLLLHAKKKYAAINMTEVDGKYVDKLEVKGLDMKRREYCALSKEASQKLLNEVLSGEDQEIVLNRVHDYLRDLASKMREFTIPVQKYVIYTKLSKKPEEYPNKESMPPVQVALRELARGKNIRPNDVISYVVTSGDSETSSLPPAKRSYTLQDVIKADSGLKPDVEFYLLKQIFPPIERLCAPIPGTDAVRLAECLGLDVRKYQINTSVANSQQNAEIFPLESQIPDSIRFENAARLTLTCRFCKERSVFEGLAVSINMCNPHGIVCPNSACQKQFTVLTIVAQLESQIRAQTSKYYEGWLVCDDSACGNRTRQMSVYGHRCLGPRGHAEGCLGKMTYEYSEKQMYNQLLYFASLWDVDKARAMAEKEASGEKKDSVAALVEFNRIRFGTVKGVVDAYLKKCGRQWVEMDNLFRFMLP